MGIVGFTCDRVECGKTFQNSRLLENHTNLHRNKLEKCFFCPWGAPVGEDGRVSAHLDRHFSQPRFKCDICGKCTYSKSNMNDHIRRMHKLDYYK